MFLSGGDVAEGEEAPVDDGEDRRLDEGDIRERMGVKFCERSRFMVVCTSVSRKLSIRNDVFR